MGKEIKIEEDESSFRAFEGKMEKPQLAALKEDWEEFKRFFEQDNKAMLEPMDLDKNFAIQVAMGSNKARLLVELLGMLDVTDRWRALRLKNVHGNNVLHYAVVVKSNVDLVDKVLKYEKEVPAPPDEEIGEGIEKGVALLDMKNKLGETPLYRAAKHGNMEMVQYMAKRVADIQSHFVRDSDKLPILHIAINAQNFDIAIWLMKVDEGLADAKDEVGLTALQLLSNMPSVFRSRSNLGAAKSFIYFLLPEQYYEYEDYDHKIVEFVRDGIDLERGKDDKKPHTSGFSRINCAMWKFLTREWDAVGGLWQTKKQHKLAEYLTGLLVQKDYSWQRSFNENNRSVVILPVVKPRNVAAKVKMLNELKEAAEPKGAETPQPTTAKRTYSQFTPLLLATKSGIVEIVKKIIEMYPEALNHVSVEGINILHVAVAGRQMEIYKIIKEYGALEWLAARIGNNGQTILHQVAKMDYYRGNNKAGYAYELQAELGWFERVKKIIPNYLEMHCNEDNLTAKEQFEIEHADMLKQAQEWIKGTSESCSAVAVLVATVVFAAAYTIPGGLNERGIPIFLRSPVFLFFTIMDVVALASSLASVVMFLSILTSPFDMWGFYKSLPRKLTLGFFLLFFSLTTTMLSFSATILLTIRLESNKWTSSLIYSAAFFPVSVFALLQFPLYMAIKDRRLLVIKKLKKIIPSRLKSVAKSKKRKKNEFRQTGF